jgi:CRISPR/Cas system-associated endonuclease/helicase Cas3
VEIEDAVSACDSPVGSGKTFAVMAHLLSQAIRRKSRRVFVVLPFTNIISQSVEAYRKALVLPGEDPAEVVAELHHRADFETEEVREFSAQWRAPIIVTTAVAFFETLASNRPAGLRRLHELPGSVIFVDEAHAALPVKLLPLAWRWMQILADEWGCYWVLASGSLVEFWRIEEISKKERIVPHIISGDLCERLSCFERKRIEYEFAKKPMDSDELINAVKSAPGPRLLIVNTVQTAGVLADRMSRSYGEQKGMSLEERKVLHLSTGLSAEDREKVIWHVKKRLEDKKRDTDWTLVATSCVEAGVDFSFHTGFRELASLLSLLQTAGRISRNGEYEDAAIWSFSLQEDPMLTSNPALADSGEVLKRFFERSIPITPALCTRAIISELNRGAELSEYLLSAEIKHNFADVEAEFNVIEGDTVLAIAGEDLKERLRFGLCDWKELQRKSISIRRSLARKMQLPCLMEGLYDWNLRYDPILGIAAGIMDVLQSKTGFLNV